MAQTLVSDVIIPSIFQPYFIERTATKSRLITSGIMEMDAEFAALANRGGQTVDMPFWSDISGADEVLSDSAALTPAKIAATQDKAAIHNRGKAWSTNDLAKWLSGDDPMAAIADRLVDYWDRTRQATLLSTLKGVFLASDSSMDGNVHAIHHTSGGAPATVAATSFTGDTFIDARQLLGDSGGELSAVICHSAVEASLRKLDLIDLVIPSDGGKPISMFQGLRLIVDDTCPFETIDSSVVYTSYIFGQGAIALGFADINTPIEGGHGTEALEFARTALNHTNLLIQRLRFVMHPRGVKWLDASVAGHSATNAELETSTNWSRVFEAKNVRIVQFRHNIL